MAPLPYAFRAWLFLRALDDMIAAYRAAAKANSNRPEEIEAEVRRRLGIGPDDPFPNRNDDDEKDPVGRLCDEAGEMEEQADRGASGAQSLPDRAVSPLGAALQRRTQTERLRPPARMAERAREKRLREGNP